MFNLHLTLFLAFVEQMIGLMPFGLKLVWQRRRLVFMWGLWHLNGGFADSAMALSMIG